MKDDSTRWRDILDRHKTGRRRILLHLIVAPIVIYGVGHIAAQITGTDPVWLYVLAFAVWFIVLGCLIQRHEPYSCPQCGTRVYPSGAVSWLPLPCSKCGLKMPIDDR